MELLRLGAADPKLQDVIVEEFRLRRQHQQQEEQDALAEFQESGIPINGNSDGMDSVQVNPFAFPNAGANTANVLPEFEVPAILHNFVPLPQGYMAMHASPPFQMESFSPSGQALTSGAKKEFIDKKAGQFLIRAATSTSNQSSNASAELASVFTVAAGVSIQMHVSLIANIRRRWRQTPPNQFCNLQATVGLDIYGWDDTKTPGQRLFFVASDGFGESASKRVGRDPLTGQEIVKYPKPGFSSVVLKVPISQYSTRQTFVAVIDGKVQVNSNVGECELDLTVLGAK